MRRRRCATALCAVAWVLGCGSSETTALEGATSPRDQGSEGPGGSGVQPPPGGEKEVESDYEAPVATGNFVWIANPKSGRVAFIDATTLQVKTVEAGNGPTYLGSVPGQATDTTVVLNVLSKDATILKAAGGKIEA